MGRKSNAQKRTEKLYKKYGDVEVGVIPNNVLNDLSDFTPPQNAPRMKCDNKSCEFLYYINHNFQMMPRYLAETDTEYRQIIPYTILRAKDEDGEAKYYVTKRIGGDNRLLDMYSLGIGGHLEDDNIYECLYRELKEETGLSSQDIWWKDFCGYIKMNKTEVDAVHIGLIFVLTVKNPAKVVVKEPESLEGQWMNYDEIIKLRSNKSMETWAEVVIDKVLRR